MDKLNFVKDGAAKLPPGFRFQPTDKEIVFEYLMRKIFCYTLPASVVPEISVYRYDPWELPGELEEDRYLFTKKEAKYQNGSSRVNRTTKSGYWKATGSDKRITCPLTKTSEDHHHHHHHQQNNNNHHDHDIIGMRKTLVFHTGKPPHGSRTEWIMHEYRLVNSHHIISTQSTSAQVGEWVLCHVFFKKRISRDQTEDKELTIIDQAAKHHEMRTYDFMSRDLNNDSGPYSSSSSSFSSSSSSSCGSSSFTEVTSSWY